MGMPDTLNQRQRMFVYHYFKGLSITRSAIEAGYSGKPECAAVIGSRLLKNVKVRNAIEYLNEQSGITPSSVISKLASVFNQKNNSIKTKASDIIKISNLFFKMWGLDLGNSGTRRPTRNKRRAGVGSISYSFDSLIKPNGDTYNKEAIKEDTSFKEVRPFNLPEPESLQAVRQANSSQEDSQLKIKRAVPRLFPRAIPKPSEMRNPSLVYSPFNFKDDDEVSRTQSNRIVFYPA